jgi:phosphoribosylanthranilate isomerase
MYKTKIYASRVTNLSDARYFAAMGVDYLGIPLDAGLKTETIKELFDWVEGPEFIGEITGIQPLPNLGSVVDILKLNKMAVNPYYSDKISENISIIREIRFEDCVVSEEEIVLKFQSPILEIDKSEEQKLREIIDSNRVWFYIEGDYNEINQIIDKYNPHGIVLIGGEEEKVGFKSFDEIDLIFDHLSA